MTHIKHVTDALATQRRLILHLACGHNVSVSDKDAIMQKYQAGDVFKCPWCPTPPSAVNEPGTPDEAREAFEDLFS